MCVIKIFGDVFVGNFDMDVVWMGFEGMMYFEKILYFIDNVIEVMGFEFCG